LTAEYLSLIWRGLYGSLGREARIDQRAAFRVEQPFVYCPKLFLSRSRRERRCLNACTEGGQAL